MNNSIRKRGRNWYVDVTYQGVRVRKVAGTNKLLAQQVANKLLNQMVEGTFFENSIKQIKITFKEYSDIYLEYSKIRKKLNTHKRNVASVKALTKRLSKLFLHHINSKKIEWYVMERLNDSSPCRPGKKITGTCVNREISCLSVIFNHAIKEGLIKHNPTIGYEKLKENKREEYLTVGEYHKLIDVSRDYIRLFVVIAVNTGLRLNNILNLKWQQINFKNNTIFVSGKETKNGENITLPITKTLKTELRKITVINKTVHVISKKNGQPYTDIRKSFKLDLIKADIKRDIKPHDLRHTFGSQSAMAEINAFTLKEFMGHKHLETTQRYTHLSIQHKKTEINKLDIRLMNNTNTQDESITLNELKNILGKESNQIKKVKAYLESKKNDQIPA